MGHHKRRTFAVLVATVAILYWCTAIGTAADEDTVNPFIDITTMSAAGQYVCVHDTLPQLSRTEEGEDAEPETDDGVAAQRSAQISSATPDEYQPIRIQIFSPDLENTKRYCTKKGQKRLNFLGETLKCRAEDVFTEKKREILFNQLIPRARALHEERVQVAPFLGNIVVPPIEKDSFCNLFTIPDAHQKEGVAGADLVLYLASSPDRFRPAWAAPCSRGRDGRPLVGVLQISTWFIEDNTMVGRALAHEMLHVLAFEKETLYHRNIFQRERNIRGKPTVAAAIQSPKVLAAARAHFGCPTLSHIELEDAGVGGESGSHWKARNMAQDLMASKTSVGYYTAITMALLEDLGYYKVNYEKAEVMPWGRYAGCEFLNAKCVQDGQTQFPSTFCTKRQSYLKCTSDRYQMGYCSIKQGFQPVPPHFQYFKSDLTFGSEDPFMDYCPIILPSTRGDTNCLVHPVAKLPGSIYGPQSRCIDITTARVGKGNSATYIGGVCAEVRCKGCSYTIALRGGRGPTECRPGTTLSLPALSTVFKNGTLTCPPFNEVCTDYIRASNS